MNASGFDTRDLGRRPSSEQRAQLARESAQGDFGTGGGDLDTLKLVIGIAFGVLLLVFVLGAASNMARVAGRPVTSLLPTVAMFAAPVAVLAVLLTLGPARRARRSASAWQPLALFARRNGLTLRRTAPTQGLPGLLFTRGSGNRLLDVVQSTGAEPGFERAGTVEYDDGDDEHDRIVRRHVVTFRLERRVPHVVLQSRSAPGIDVGFGRVLDQRSRVPLEGPAEPLYRLYAPGGRSADALQLLSLDVVEQLVAHPLPYDVELVDDRVNLCGRGELDVSRPEAWQRIADFERRVLPRLQHTSGRYVDRGPAAMDPTPARTNGNSPAAMTSHRSRRARSRRARPPRTGSRPRAPGCQVGRGSRNGWARRCHGADAPSWQPCCWEWW